MPSAQQGFTLVELIVTLALSVIVIAFMAQFVSVPVAGYVDQTRRAELVDMADASIHRLARDVRNALPNSLRVRSSGSIVALELLAIEDGARYRDTPPPANADSRLDFSAPDDAFNVVGGFANLALPFASVNHYLSVYNVGAPGADAYELANVITPPGTSISIDAAPVPGEDRINVSPAFRFTYQSPQKRVFLVQGPVTWLCDVSNGTLSRYSGYSIATDHADRDSDTELLAAGAAAARVTESVAVCDFRYDPGTAERSGLLTAALEIRADGEAVTMLHQLHTDNVP